MEVAKGNISQTSVERRTWGDRYRQHKRKLGWLAVGLFSGAAIITDNNPELLDYSGTLGDYTLNTNMLLPFAIATGYIGVRNIHRENAAFKELINGEKSTMYANPNIALQEDTISTLKKERRRKLGSLSAATVATVALLTGMSDTSITSEKATIDSLAVIVATGLDSRDQDVTAEDGSDITRAKAQIDGAIQLGDELRGVPTTYVAASGNGNIVLIGRSEGSVDEDNTIVDGFNAFLANKAASLPNTTGDDINASLIIAKTDIPDHTIIIGNFESDNRPSELADQDQPSENEVSIIAVNPSEKVDEDMKVLVGEEDYYTATSTTEVSEAVRQIVKNNSLTVIKKYNVSEWMTKLGVASAVALALGVFSRTGIDNSARLQRMVDDYSNNKRQRKARKQNKEK